MLQEPLEELEPKPTENVEIKEEKIDALENIIETTDSEIIDNHTDPENCENVEKTEGIDIDESSNSTFQLPPEFVADSDNSLPIFEGTPKKLKTVDIKTDSSLEISADDEVVNIDVVKMEDNSEEELKSANVTPIKPAGFKFSPLQKETDNKLDIDLESFKDHYLKEVDRYKCDYSHKHKHGNTEEIKPTLRTAIDFAIDAIFKKETDKDKPQTKKLKRKLDTDDLKVRVPKKKAKRKCVLKYNQNEANIRVVCSNTEKVTDTIDLTLESTEEKRKRKKMKKRRKLQRENIHVKIKWRKEQLKLKITKSQPEKKRKLKKGTPTALKQYILKYSPGSSSNVLMKPEIDVTPKRRKYTKLERSPDNLFQTSIQNFFKVKPSE